MGNVGYGPARGIFLDSVLSVRFDPALVLE
jgi:hypothetical protein